MERIAVVGLGAVGSPVARRLLACGYDVTVWNRTRERAALFARAGAVVAAEHAGRAGQDYTVLLARILRQATKAKCGVTP
ncbi:hypothetical protein GCM10010442_15280 [Kitasatospora kifunensis]|uniref:3-hydroxyisobutyrate dehydrogenase-like beta-hydroxyacid dehydrogenase n=1 Tax=Kitasatospora kifunensis TaxID=58351 RepID=A0A7W7VTI9_KITKI|nr:3-hydroxyisobutyrate dehydrogenase-like beta-hydroxyacid dehydrogenase [Kitasatospora kifunensis]